MTLFFATFSTVNPTFLHEDLISRQKTVYMKNAQERARFEIFWRKSWIFMFSLSKSTKNTEKHANYLLCDFLRNRRSPDNFGNQTLSKVNGWFSAAIGNWKVLLRESKVVGYVIAGAKRVGWC